MPQRTHEVVVGQSNLFLVFDLSTPQPPIKGGFEEEPPNSLFGWWGPGATTLAGATLAAATLARASLARVSLAGATLTKRNLPGGRAGGAGKRGGGNPGKGNPGGGNPGGGNPGGGNPGAGNQPSAGANLGGGGGAPAKAWTRISERAVGP